MSAAGVAPARRSVVPWRSARGRQALRRTLTAYLFLLPTFIILGTFLVYPLFASVWYSLHEYNVIQPAKWIGLANYRELLDDEIFQGAFWNTLVYSAVVVPGCVILPLLMALLVNKPARGVAFFRAVFYLPVITSIVIVGIVWKWMYFEDGIINSLLRGLRIVEKPVPFLSNPDIALYAIIAVTIWKASGYYMVIYLAGMQSLPQELDEAARIDGANRWQRLWDVTIPLLKPVITLVAVIASIAAMKVFGEIYVMTSGGPAESTNTLVYYVYVQAFNFLRMGYASAVAVVLCVFLIVLSLVSIKLSERGGTSHY